MVKRLSVVSSLSSYPISFTRRGLYGLFFLGAHFVWAFSLMFLFSGRGYWQELIESIVWAHQLLHVTPSIFPRALSITQGRAVGVSHYLLGGIVTTWSFFLALRGWVGVPSPLAGVNLRWLIQVSLLLPDQ